jgi:sialic acid synthase SpsE
MIFKKEFKINKTLISKSKGPYVIAEIGSNHNQSLKTALKLVDVAKKNKCDAIKVQIIYPEGIAVNRQSKYGKINNKFKKYSNNLYDLYAKCSLKFNEFEILKKYSKKKDIDFIASVFCKKSLNDAIKLDVDAIKVASLEIYDHILLGQISKIKKPVIISSGTATFSDIEKALKIFKKNKHKKVCLLHCVSSYPAKYDEMNIKFVSTLQEKLKIPIGFSDHTLDYLSAVTATCLGAAIIEKHITLSRKLFGPDHFFSLNPKQLNLFMKKIFITKKILGNKFKTISDVEKKISLKASRSVFSKTIIKKNEIITFKNIKIVRPGDGLKPEFLNKIINKKINKDIPMDYPINVNLIKK